MNGYLHHLVSRALDTAPVLKPRLPAWFEPVAPRTPALQEIDQEQEAPDTPRPAPERQSPPRPRLAEAPAFPAPPERPAAVQGLAESMATVPPAPAPPPTAASVRIEREVREHHEVFVQRRIEEKPSPPSPASEPRRAVQREASGPALQAADARIRPRAESPIPAPPVSAFLVPKEPMAAAAQALNPVTASVAAPGPAPRPDNRPPPQPAALVPKSMPAGALPALRPAAVPQAVQAPPPRPVEPPVIEISIGRVEVRAVSAPAPAAAPRQRSAAPMLSLDDYLKQKDGRTT